VPQICRILTQPARKRNFAVYRLAEIAPNISADAYVAPNAMVIGNVQLDKGSSVWFGATVRGDNELIHVGENSNVQDGCTLHTDEGFPLTIGKNVTIGHMVMLHGCDIGDGSLIGIGSTILNGAKIGKNCLIGAHTLLPEGKVIPDNSLVMGSPGKIVKTVTPQQIEFLGKSAAGYVGNAIRFRRDCRLVQDDIDPNSL